jgi:hypothetical protein
VTPVVEADIGQLRRNQQRLERGTKVRGCKRGTAGSALEIVLADEESLFSGSKRWRKAQRLSALSINT